MAFRLPASIEIPVKQALDSTILPDVIPNGTRVYLPDMGTSDDDMLVRAARRLTDLGLIAVPHIAARRLASRAALQDRVAALTQSAGVRDLLLIGGDPTSPSAAYPDVMSVLETGILDQFGIAAAGIAGHPEGSSGTARDVVSAALRNKASFQERSDASFRIVTQFGFDAPAFIAWSKEIAAQGIDLPIHIGLAGPAKLPVLIRFAAACGVGNSLAFLRKRAGSVGALLRGFSPDEIAEPFEAHVQNDPTSTIRQLHVFAFGGIADTSDWLHRRGSWTAGFMRSGEQAHAG